MKYFAIIFAFTTSAVFAQADSSAQPRNEVVVSGEESPYAAYLGSSGYSSFALSSSYHYLLNDFLQVGGGLSVATSGGYSGVSLKLAPTFNFGEKDILHIAYYVRPFLSISNVSGDYVNYTATYLGLNVGKRFMLLPNVTYTPSIEFATRLSSSYARSNYLQINLFALSIVW